ncbi:AAA family ATPase [Actinopolyspora halophila]|uniref:AAA family ATPase n=1 Tax=Actinopolyspora halophila TaxID=1850 RepID=UPI000374E55E|nr:AAA family ATPase [Actinopolyspora halophila]
MFTPTDEQRAVLDTLPTADRLKVTAGAGAGKTAVLVQCAELMRGKKVLYTAFNRGIVQEGKGKFGANTDYLTSHKLAYDAVAKPYLKRLNDTTRQPGKEKAKLLRLLEPYRIGDLTLRPGTLARLASDGVENFCNGSDDEPQWFHMPNLDGIDQSESRALRQFLQPYAAEMWEELQLTDAQGGEKFPFTPNHFRKLWQLTRPTLPYDVLLVDEAQDSAEVFMDVIRRQGAQTVLIGDTAQAINEWAGARDAIQSFDAPELRLTQSFRFGQEVADEANLWLELLGTSMRITGTGSSLVGPSSDPTAVLTRTNGEAVVQLMQAQSSGRKVALAGTKAKSEIEQLCDAADGLKQGKGTHVKALMAFTYWSELQQYAHSEGRDLKPFVEVVDMHGTDVVRRALRELVAEQRAERVISTAHVSKGLEFERVKIGADFTEPTSGDGTPKDPSPQEIKLGYVALTRAQEQLDLGGLAWLRRRREREARGQSAGVHGGSELEVGR